MVIIGVLSLILSLLLALWLHKRLNNPLINIIENVSQISQSKNYQRKIDKQAFKELDILAKNINILLNRTAKHVGKVEDDHQHALNQNDELKSNIFLRSDNKEIKTNLGINNSTSLTTFSKLRDLKDNF